MRIVHVLRKPLGEGSVAANVLKHGTGAVNVDAGRIAAGGAAEVAAKLGRWPANLILQHLSGCRRLGAKQVKAISGGPASGDNAFGQDTGWNAHENKTTGITRQGNGDGTETVESWACVPGCPVVELDLQSGTSKSAGGRSYQNTNDMYSGGWEHKGTGVAVDPGFGDVGGASRFYKQVKGDEGMGETLPADLINYLTDLIAPKHLDDCMVLYVSDFTRFGWAAMDAASLHGMVAVTPPGGDLSPWLDDIWRVLKPGAHLLLVAPVDQPTGHTGACMAEDKGFEVRDAILLVQEAGRLHYVPKANQKERHAGCEHLKLRRHEEAAEPEEPEDGEEVVEEVEEEVLNELDTKNLHKGNNHPTVKAVDIMVRLLGDVPPEAVVLDPFMGSGTTGVACLRTGHSFIGIEREPDYLIIADTRIKHWDRMRVGDGATIKSEAPEYKPVEEESNLDDFFGL